MQNGRPDTNAPGGATMPGNTPAEVPADNRDPGNEIPMPDGDTTPTPDTTSPTPTPTEVPKTGGAFSGDARDGDEIDADTIQNGSLGNAVAMNAGTLDGTSSTEAALKRATE